MPLTFGTKCFLSTLRKASSISGLEMSPFAGDWVFCKQKQKKQKKQTHQLVAIQFQFQQEKTYTSSFARSLFRSNHEWINSKLQINYYSTTRFFFSMMCSTKILLTDHVVNKFFVGFSTTSPSHDKYLMLQKW